ncbi:MAG TPA: hypothetical protein VGJ84_20475 [Polyangiaceae bacterium]
MFHANLGRAIPAAALIGSALGCGPSVHSVHEGWTRFEHCYRLDLDEEIAPPHQQACWREWTQRYTYGQPRDRIEYARRRLRELVSGDADRPALNVDAGYRPEERQFYLSVPAPTSAHSPPPPIATRWYAPPEQTAPAAVTVSAPSAPPAARPIPAAPGDECANGCRSKRAQCLDSCQRGGGPDAGAATRSEKKPPQASQKRKQSDPARPTADAGVCSSCDADYKACTVRCYK